MFFVEKYVDLGMEVSIDGFSMTTTYILTFRALEKNDILPKSTYFFFKKHYTYRLHISSINN